MKKWLLVLLVLFSICSVQASERNLKLLWRDYNLSDEDTRPLSAGLMLWESKELPSHFGPYGSIAPLSYYNFRAEVGGMATWNEKKDRVEIGMLTGLSYRFSCNVVMGVWYAPFWNTYGKNPDDPWGLMIGYAFPTPGWTPDWNKLFRK
jgi:hypothetical protein